VNAANRGLGGALDRLYRAQDHAPSALDPIHLVRRYEHPADREIAGFCAAALALGRVAGAMRVIERLLEPMGPSPAAYVRRFDPARDGRAVASIAHRWIRAATWWPCSVVLHTMIASSGTIEGFFADGFDRTAPDVQADSSRSRRGRYRWISGPPTAACRECRASAASSPPVGRQRLQAPESLPALDGPARRDRTWVCGRRLRRLSWSCPSIPT